MLRVLRLILEMKLKLDTIDASSAVVWAYHTQWNIPLYIIVVAANNLGCC